MKTNETDEQLLALMTHVQAFLKGRLTLGELAEAEERAEIFRTNQVTNYDEVDNLKGIIKELKRILSTCMYALQENEELEQGNAELMKDNAVLMKDNAELMKDKERLDWLIDHAYIQFYKVDDGGEWEMELDASDARNHIDKEMEDAQWAIHQEQKKQESNTGWMYMNQTQRVLS